MRAQSSHKYLQKAGAYTLDYYQRSLYMMQKGWYKSPLSTLKTYNS